MTEDEWSGGSDLLLQTQAAQEFLQTKRNRWLTAITVQLVVEHLQESVGSVKSRLEVSKINNKMLHFTDKSLCNSICANLFSASHCVQYLQLVVSSSSP